MQQLEVQLGQQVVGRFSPVDRRQGQDDHGVAAERRSEGLAGRGQPGQPAVRGRHRGQGQHPVAAVVELHHQAGLHLRRQHRHPGRGRAGQHPDRLLHRRRRLRRPDQGQGPVRQLGQLAAGPDRLGHLARRQARGHSVLRRQPGRDLPQGPVQQGRHHRRADHAGRAELRPGQGQGRQRRRQGVLRLLHAGQVLVRGDVVRVRRRRQDRRAAERQVGRHPGEQRRPSRAWPRGRS